MSMDPQSLAFQPQSEVWQLSTMMRNVQDVQQDHGDRLSRLERRHDEEAKVKSVWGPTSPFPGVLSGTPSHGRSVGVVAGNRSPAYPYTTAPSRHQSTVDFAGFDEEQPNNMVRSLQLDADDEPRRLGATSRANSVRFDESANQGQWSHASRNSMDISRTSTGLPGLGHPLFERTTSHKSDGRHSSAGLSAASGRANSFGLDSSIGALSTAPMHPPGLAPGLFILGSVPSIIRCWLTANFKHDTLLYAAVCTGSYKSFLDSRLITELGLTGHIGQDINGDYKIKVPMYLPEAIPHPSSSRSGSPAPQLPTITVDFTVTDFGEQHSQSKAIRIFVGSDLLRAHNADILFSTNTLSAFDDERTKLSIPLVRPENDATFKSLYITSGTPTPFSMKSQTRGDLGSQTKSAIGTEVQNGDFARRDTITEIKTKETAALDGPTSASADAVGIDTSSRSSPAPSSENKGQSQDGRPSLGRLSTEQKSEEGVDDKDPAEPSSAVTSGSRTSASPAIWNNWRREGSTSTSQSGQSDWANVSRNSSRSTFSTRASRDGGIKVLKPTRTLSRTSNAVQSAGPTVTGQSRLFDDGKKRNGDGPPPRSATMPEPPPDVQKRTASIDLSSKPGSKENTPAPNKPRNLNPIGGASAFGWLNSGGQEK